MKSALKVLIIGGDSTIGNALVLSYSDQGSSVISTTRRRELATLNRPYIDLSDISTFFALEKYKFDIAILCGSVTSVKECEDYPSETWRINVENTLTLTDMLAKSCSKILYISSDLVFDGTKAFANTNDTRSPICNYGRQKAAVEESLISHLPTASIIRLGKVLSPVNPLLLGWAESLANNIPIYPYSNKMMAPISLRNATDIIMWLTMHASVKLSQFTASSEISYSDAAYRIANKLSIDSDKIETLIHPVSNTKLLPRLIYSTMNASPELCNFSSPPSPYESVDIIASSFRGTSF